MRKEEVVLIDDKARSRNPDSMEPADETLLFMIDGEYRAMDLNGKHAEQFRRVVEPWVKIARRVPPPSRQRVRTPSTRKRSADIRAWAKQQGHVISERGRIPADVVRRYELAAA